MVLTLGCFARGPPLKLYGWMGGLSRILMYSGFTFALHLYASIPMAFNLETKSVGLNILVKKLRKADE